MRGGKGRGRGEMGRKRRREASDEEGKGGEDVR